METVVEKGARLLKLIADLRAKQAEMDRLLLELQGVAEIMAHGIDPKRIRTWKPWWPVGSGSNVPKGTEVRLKAESGKPEDDKYIVLKGFLPTDWSRKLRR